MASDRHSNKNIFALILAGGVGSRFWPFSRELEPKQFMELGEGGSLIQNTLFRLQGLVRPRQIYIITRFSYFFELKRQIKKFHIPEVNILLEPEAKNTAPAIGYCARLIEQLDKDATLIVLPSDHFIRDLPKFKMSLLRAIDVADLGFLVTLGIKPKRISTGYGYIKIKRPHKRTNKRVCYYKVDRFLEKPSLEKAKKYMADRDYFWNSGIFVWKVAAFLEELKRYLPALYSQLMSINSIEDINKVWHRVKPISVDYGILERSGKIALLPATFSWADLGSWDALEDVLGKDKHGNLIQADSVDLDSKGICVFSRGKRLIATIGLEDLIIADTPDALMVCDRSRSQDVKKIIEKLKSSKRKEHIRHLTEKRPWGSYTVLQTAPGFKIKLVQIESGKRLSLQSHSKRAEHWVVVSGCAKVISCGKKKLIKSNQSIYIPKGTKHRLENPRNSTLKIVEVQTGKYLEEDDIKRFDDDFLR
ncbi:MAG: mannose-1-phosphate guanylyltransferase/mannose-6-phosphate isomerase [Candidatus Omnitrophica bacterium]|nr:mannose-1-phosphate guanylyltransferase/mannose-6-phosphate isomerase [Candidatus Omnitrophota bacterium]